MSYLLREPEAMGLDLDALGKGLGAAAKIVEDPALPEVACNVLRLNQATEGRAVDPPCTRRTYSDAQRARGIGLRHAIVPLRVATWARQHPAMATLAALGAVGALVGVGYLLGRSGRR